MAWLSLVGSGIGRWKYASTYTTPVIAMYSACIEVNMYTFTLHINT